MSGGLLIGGTSFESIAGVTVPDWNMLLDVDVFRGANKVLPGIDGEIGVELVRDAYDIPPIGFSLKAADRAGLYTAVAAIRALFPTTLVTLTRVDDSATCSGQYRGIAWSGDHETDIDGTLFLRNLDGAWA